MKNPFRKHKAGRVRSAAQGSLDPLSVALDSTAPTSPTSMAAPTIIENDPIADSIRDFVDKERASNFHFMGERWHGYTTDEVFHLAAGSIAEIEPICKRKNYDLASHLASIGETTVRFYTFRRVISKLAETLPVRLLPSRSASSSDEIRIDDIQVLDWINGGSWLDLREWMRKEYTWDLTYDWKKDRQGCIDEMSVWWNSNGKSFRILDLALELRELLYVAIIGTVIFPKITTTDPWKNSAIASHTHQRQRLVLGNGHSYPQQRGQKKHDPSIAPPNLAILQLNKQIYDEALQAAWRCSTKRFRGVDLIMRSEPAPNTQYKTLTNALQKFVAIAPALEITHHALNNVQLELTAAQYFQLLGFTPVYGNPWAQTSHWNTFHIRALRNMTTLSKLDLRFISPKHADAKCPWSIYPGEHSCQKVWIDWFLEMAAPLLCRPQAQRSERLRVTLSGCIKTSTRAKWMPILADERYATVDDDSRRRIAEIKQIHDEFMPISCNCSMPCSRADSFDPWSAFSEAEQRGIVGMGDEISEQYWSYRD